MTREERDNAIRCLKIWIEREPQLQIYKTCLEALEQEPCDNIGEVFDGYHTFNQLYHQRAVLFATIVNQNKNKSWKSFKHSDGNYCFDSNGEWFIVGIDTPQGSYTYHYAKEYWDMFNCEELECGKEWDGHTEEDVTRLLSLEQEPCDVFDEYGNYKYPSDVELTEPNTAMSMPSGDTISRQAALKELKESAKYHANDSREEALLRRDRDIIKALPSVIMRDATPEEQKSVNNYIKSISKPTGINFWDLDDNDDCISRKAVLSLLADHFDNVFDMVKELPSVAIPSEHDGCEDCKKVIPSADDMFSDLKAEISMYENSDQSIDEMIQGIKSIISIYER